MADAIGPLCVIISFRNACRQELATPCRWEKILFPGASKPAGIRFIKGMDPNKPAVTLNDISSEERRDALADVLAEGIVYLGQRGLLDFVPATSSNLPSPPEEGRSSNEPERP